jgi:hypothetical protein
VRDEFDLSASNILLAPRPRILLTVFSENEMKQQVLQARSIELRDEFDLSASASLIAPSSSISFAALSENEMIKRTEIKR